ncbi:uncharacterized protein LACBIDRAFT_320862 [Laccaria bicolor S238N-H82]|uniref:Predicted protein n=1 Tax=Laccaria bicolor (strain S238N-H82 / ATCC MYA-4686) TaxID=486041 RepID=B0CRI7_LACBS|nr:uncharacterized protein LACBIDRAFT_320862 [Laccaria bicolor S238N-H82]EDR15827.1 predicted protein [Laccaria bicolor S238N-H82]|eukprot:XP_001874035.1 predicted protein [Laccaria bicolor S238N-H82]
MCLGNTGMHWKRDVTCHSEMRPLMVPDPVCASCHGSFVERVILPLHLFKSSYLSSFRWRIQETILANLLTPITVTLMDHLPTWTLFFRYGTTVANPDTKLYFTFTFRKCVSKFPFAPLDTSYQNNRMSFQISGPNGSRTVTLGGINTLGDHSGPNPASVPTMSEFLGPNPQGEGGARITGPLIAQYLAALLGQHDPLASFFGGQSPGGIPENGRMGDYVFNQEALDQIITQIMEGSNAHRPVPATDEIIDNLPREVLMVGSATLQNDCAVCKDQFKLHTDDPDEQVVVTLPCKHPFHEPCIIPWLKSSGTCPVCRESSTPGGLKTHTNAFESVEPYDATAV